MGPRAGFGTLFRPVARLIRVSEEYSSKNMLYDAVILVHRQVAKYAVDLDRDRSSGLVIVAAGFRHAIIDIDARGIGVVCVFDGVKQPGKIVNHTRAQRVTKFRVILEPLRTGQSEEIMTAQEQTDTEARYLKQCTMVNEDMILAVIHELEHSGLKWRRAPYEADAEMAYLVNAASSASMYSAIINADLDLVVHGAPALITNYDDKTAAPLCTSRLFLDRMTRWMAVSCYWKSLRASLKTQSEMSRMYW